MSANRSPCKPDCPKRCVGCHGKCLDYIKFDEENKKRRKDNLIRQYSTKCPNKSQR